MSLFNVKSKFLTSLKVDLKAVNFIHIKEGNLADGNFVLTYILKEILSDNEKNSICFVNFHNSINHYQNIGRRLHYNFNEKIDKKKIAVVNGLEDILEELISTENSEKQFLKQLKDKIINAITTLKNKKEENNEDNNNIFLVIDDLSHLSDLSISYKDIMLFVNFCVNLQDEEGIKLVIGSHCSGEDSNDIFISNSLSYICDVTIAVNSLKTGVCAGVSGVINVTKKDNTEDTFHFKTSDKFVQVFNPGATLAALRL